MKRPPPESYNNKKNYNGTTHIRLLHYFLVR